MSKSLCIPFVLSFALLAGCASSQIKARKDQREKASQASGMYCDFVNGELYPDVEVQLNLEMAKRCDDDKSYTITNYKTSNENMGLVYCCSLNKEHSKKPEAQSSAKAAAAPTASAGVIAPAGETKKADAKKADGDGLDD